MKTFNNTSAYNSNRRKKKFGSYKIYLPINLDLENILQNNPPCFNRLPNNYRNIRDKMAYILHLINAIPNGKKDFDIDAEKGFIPINKEILSKRVHDYKDYINYLIEQGIITEGTGYAVGKKSKGLKFTKKYKTPVVANYITTQSLIKSIVRKRPNRDYDAEAKLMFLKQFLNSDLTLDYSKALKALEDDMPNAKAKLILKRQEKKYTKAEFENLPDLDEAILVGFNSKWITVEKIHTASYDDYPFIDSTTGRLHSPFVVLYKKLRSLLRYKGEFLGNVDIVNSQPFLSIVLLDSKIFSKLNIGKLVAKYNPLFREEKNNISNPYYTMLVNLIHANENKPDVVNYKQAITQGRYYEYFAEQLLKNGLIPQHILQIENVDEREKTIRAYAKNATFRALFDKVNASRWNKEVEVFSQCFPNVYKIFQFVKKGYQFVEKTKKGKKVLLKKGYYNTLACVLQRFESYLVLHRVCVDIHNNHPEIPLYTIHDSIATTKPNVELVKYYFQKHIKDFIGIEPKLDVSIWE